MSILGGFQISQQAVAELVCFKFQAECWGAITDDLLIGQQPVAQKDLS